MTNKILPNIKAMLRRYGLWKYIKEIDLVKDDRVYAKVSYELELALDQGEEFRRSYPVSKVHAGLEEYYFGSKPIDGDMSGYVSYRSNSSPSLQITLLGHEVGSPVVDIDIDLGNPFRSIWDGIVHWFEVLIPGKTDHNKVYKKLRKSDEWKEYFDD